MLLNCPPPQHARLVQTCEHQIATGCWCVIYMGRYSNARKRPTHPRYPTPPGPHPTSHCVINPINWVDDSGGRHRFWSSSSGVDQVQRARRNHDMTRHAMRQGVAIVFVAPHPRKQHPLSSVPHARMLGHRAQPAPIENGATPPHLAPFFHSQAPSVADMLRQHKLMTLPTLRCAASVRRAVLQVCKGPAQARSPDVLSHQLTRRMQCNATPGQRRCSLIQAPPLLLQNARASRGRANVGRSCAC